MINIDNLTLKEFEDMLNKIALRHKNKRDTSKEIKEYVMNSLYINLDNIFGRSIPQYESKNLTIGIDTYRGCSTLNKFSMRVFNTKCLKGFNLIFNKDIIHVDKIENKICKLSEKPIDIIDMIKKSHIVRLSYCNDLNLDMIIEDLFNYY